MKITIHLPDHVGVLQPYSYKKCCTNDDLMPEKLSRMMKQQTNNETKFHSSTIPLWITVAIVKAKDAKVMWSFLKPLLLETDTNVSARAVFCLLKLPLLDPNMVQSGGEASTTKTLPHTKTQHTITKRSLVFHAVATKQLFQTWSFQSQQQPVAINILLLPYNQTRIEYTFAGYLIAWEHRILRAQSLNGYVSTLGGGFFLCHHFQTAIRLAQEQQRLAIILQRPDVYWTGWIHQAYSHIYAGHFRTALWILRAVQDNNRHLSVLTNMCESARLQCQRMKRAALASSRTSQTMDDWVRIRVVHDQSKEEDLRKSLTVVPLL